MCRWRHIYRVLQIFTGCMSLVRARQTYNRAGKIIDESMNAAIPGRRTWWVAIALLVITAQAQAQQPPDAEPCCANSRLRLPPCRPPAPIPVRVPDARRGTHGPTIRGQGDPFHSAVLIPEAELQGKGLRAAGPDASTSEYAADRGAADGLLPAKGYLARVIVPSRRSRTAVVDVPGDRRLARQPHHRQQGQPVDTGRSASSSTSGSAKAPRSAWRAWTRPSPS
jgi:hypothetical protein